MSAAAQAHIDAQARLRAITVAAIARAWQALLSYDETNVPAWLQMAVPLTIAAQTQSAALTNAFIAQELGRPPLPIDVGAVTGAALRNGVDPAEVYRRPFVTVWTALKEGQPWEDAVAGGAHRLEGTAALDVQLAMRETLRVVGEADRTILGYARVADVDACDFCKLIAGMRYRVRDLMPVHTRCGCGVEVITAENRHLYAGNPLNDLQVTRDGLTAAVETHGELGPVLVNGEHHFAEL